MPNVSVTKNIQHPVFQCLSIPLLLTGVQSNLDRQLVEEKWEMLCEMMQEKAAFVFGRQGCLTDTELHTVLKVIIHQETHAAAY